ncbi:hypothetical protein GCM10010972_22740 [Cellulomonas carbonis]|nr:hypothetical protein GCM10010972_22740 [Cellulomonas carbonis]
MVVTSSSSPPGTPSRQARKAVAAVSQVDGSGDALVRPPPREGSPAMPRIVIEVTDAPQRPPPAGPPARGTGGVAGTGTLAGAGRLTRAVEDAAGVLT